MDDNGGLSNLFIQNVAGKYARNSFAGTFSSNNIPRNLAERPNFTFICNLDKVGEVGSHFVTVVADPENIIYVDPLGLPCLNKDISCFLKQSGRRVSYNTRTIQHPLSNFCGFYALLYVLHFDYSVSNKKKKKTRYNLKLVFKDTQLEENDARCLEYLKYLLTAAIK